MAEQTPQEIIQQNAQAPRRVSGDTGSAEQHSIPDQIAAAKFASSNTAARRGLGIRYVKLRPPSPSGVDLDR